MELCIKTAGESLLREVQSCFNPCFNGTMYKNISFVVVRTIAQASFNPCFNGTMYKNGNNTGSKLTQVLFQSLF